MTAHPTPIRAIGAGLFGAAVGTLAMDASLYARHRLGGGKQPFLAFEFSADIADWEHAPAPAQVGRRLVEGLFGVTLAPSRARRVSNAMHWVYGTANGAALGVVAGSRRARRARLGPAFGLAVWSSSYALLTPMGLYKAPWRYPPAVVAKDVGHHLVYGTVSGLTTALLLR